jgi:hypothetical protein
LLILPLAAFGYRFCDTGEISWRHKIRRMEEPLMSYRQGYPSLTRRGRMGLHVADHVAGMGGLSYRF